MRMFVKMKKKRNAKGILAVLVLVLIFMLCGCGGGKGSGGDNTSAASDNGSGNGELYITLTDNQGEFLNYTVDVLSIRLEKANGAVVETMPPGENTRVDFAQYTEMTEFLTACTVPSGVYVKATMRLDYSNADIRVEDAEGNALRIAPDNIVDEDGHKITELTVSIQIDELNALVIRPGVPAHLGLDFDLKVSNSIEWVEGVPVITVSPVLLADLEPHAWKTNRIRGPLDDVHAKAGWFDIIIRPFVHVIGKGDISNRFGTARVYTDKETLYVIDGKQYQGDDGIEQLDGLTKYSAVLVFGGFIKETGRIKFKAKEIIAGSSVAGGTLDVVAGNVIKRNNDTVTIRGATLIRKDGTVLFRNTVDVDLEDAMVGKQYVKGLVNKDAISIGQRLVVFGTLSDAADFMTTKYAHMYLTTVNGTVNDVTSKQLDMDLNSIDGRDISIFDFTGTAANPDGYLVGSGSLNLFGISEGTPVKAIGFPVPFGSAETPPYDFSAYSIINVSKVSGVMVVGWGREGSASAVSISETGLELDLNGAGYFHYLNRAGVVTDLEGLWPVLTPNEDSGIFCISQGGMLKVFSKFDAFTGELSSDLAGGAKVRHLVATGLWDDMDSVLSGRFIAVRLK
jgi:hypothetical protein